VQAENDSSFKKRGHWGQLSALAYGPVLWQFPDNPVTAGDSVVCDSSFAE
jgi:hypothetical protein